MEDHMAEEIINLQKKQMEELERDNEEKNNLINELREKVDSLVKIRSENKDLKNMIDSMREQVTNKNDSIVNLTKKNILLQKDIYENDNYLTHLHNERDNARIKIKRTNVQLEELISSFQESEETKISLKNQVENLRKEINGINRTHSENEKDYISLVNNLKNDLTSKNGLENQRNKFFESFYHKFLILQHKVVGLKLTTYRMLYKNDENKIDEMRVVESMWEEWERFKTPAPLIKDENESLHLENERLQKRLEDRFNEVQKSQLFESDFNLETSPIEERKKKKVEEKKNNVIPAKPTNTNPLKDEESIENKFSRNIEEEGDTDNNEEIDLEEIGLKSEVDIELEDDETLSDIEKEVIDMIDSTNFSEDVKDVKKDIKKSIEESPKKEKL